MKTALDVGKYLIHELNKKRGIRVTQLKIQKLVYYAQASSLAFRNKPLFDDELQAWVHGSVAVSLRSKYGNYDASYLPYPDSSEIRDDWTSDEKKVLNTVLEVYGLLGAKELEELNHSETPWINARKGLPSDTHCRNPIAIEDMEFYQSQFVADKKNYKYVDYITSKDKEQYIDFTFLDGKTKKVKGTQIEEFLGENIGNLKHFRHRRRGVSRSCIK